MFFVHYIKKIAYKGNRCFQYLIIKILQKMQGVIDSSYRYSILMASDTPRILVIRLDEIGDMVLMSPFLRELRHNYLSAHITLIVKPEVYNLVELCPYVDKVLTFSRKKGRCSFYINLWRSFLFSYRHFRKKHYDLALVPRFDEDRGYGAGVLAVLSSASQRVGYSEYVLPNKILSDKGYDGFYTDVLLPPMSTVSHEVERNLDILRFVGGAISNTELEVWTAEKDAVRVGKMLWKTPGKSVKRLAVVLSAGRKNKEWDIYFYIQTIQNIAKEIPLQILLLGAGVDAGRKGEIFCSCVPDTMNLINKTTLRESVEALKTCDCYLGGDTGLLHIAAALKMKGVALFVNRLEWRKDGIDTPDRFGPWKSEMSILQPNAPLPGCEHGCNCVDAHCVQEISVGEVQKRLMLALGKDLRDVV